MQNNEFITPPNHKAFLAKKIFGNVGEITDGSIAYMEAGGGGPIEQHTHPHSHLFIVVDGEAKLLLGDKEIILKADESFLVDGTIPHSLWNNSDKTTKAIGITIKKIICLKKM